jgi:hypothetical protein
MIRVAFTAQGCFTDYMDVEFLPRINDVVILNRPYEYVVSKISWEPFSKDSSYLVPTVHLKTH